jgi:glyoxylase-like metal-dependent hydrolase (beta-lactamase superfamily II)
VSALRVVPVVTDVELPAGVAGPEPMSFDVRCFLLPHDDGVTLIDTGWHADGEPIAAALRGLGAEWTDVSDVILTHAHPDHVGALATVTALAPSATLWGGRDDVFPSPVRAVADGDTVRGLRIVATPGHTPGHLCVLDEDHGTLFTGDAVGSDSGGLTQGPEGFITDHWDAVRSLRRLADLRADRMLLGHGDEIPDPADALVRFVDRLD